MDIELKVDDKYKGTKIIIETDKIDDKLSRIIDTLKQEEIKIKVYEEEETYLLNVKDIKSVYSNEKKVFVRTEQKEFTSRQRLYELEELLPRKDFVRISNSEIINLNKVKSINTKISGTIVITFYDETKTYSSRRYINKIKEALGL
jgi:DNA-binding LytR/AlgR family response regulator